MSNEKKSFFSIKWKLLLLLSILIGASHTAQYAISYNQINDHFNQQHIQEQHHQLSIIGELIEQSARLMEQIAELILVSYGQAPTDIEKHIDEQWESLQTNWGLTTISIYNAQGQSKKVWGSSRSTLIQPDDLKLAFQTEAPIYRLRCASQCYQIIYLPTAHNLDNGHGLIILTRSLADIIISFEKTTNTDIAILSPQLDTKNHSNKPLKVVASTAPKKLKQLLENFTKQHPIQSLSHDESPHQFIDDKQFSLRLFNLGDPTQPNSPYLLIANDLTVEYALITQSKKEVFYAILLSLFVSAIILLPILLKQAQRLINVSNTLPALSEGDFNQVKKYLQHAKSHSHKTFDEFDILEKSTLAVAKQLEKSDRLIKAKEQSLIWLADHDPLTTLFNRRRFQAEFEQQLKIATRYKTTGAIIYLDLDQFKYVNDTSGHAAGDLLLKQVAGTLQQQIRSSDTLARLGGDEFAFLIPDTDAASASLLAEKILNQLRLICFESSGHKHHITASIGIAIFPGIGLSAETLMANADIAMYQAKDSGRGKSHIYSLEEKTKETLKKHVTWKDKIESALAEKRLVLHFQPILDIKKQTISHAEALVRISDENGELIMPNDFIPTAEQSGLINQIDIAVLDLAFEKLRVLHKQSSPLKLSVNFSGKAFNNAPLIKHLKEQLSQHDFDANKLILEVTETTAVANLSTAVQLMNDIKKTGAQFALDDFGVGYASFFYLRQLPVDYVKIDGTFIQQLGQDPEDQVFVKAISEITKLSGKKTIAEFVEDQVTLELLEKFKIDYAQGYHIAKPSAEIPSI